MSNLKNISEQRGTLLMEAIAMLGLIALVTPTLYKKSAERLQEIQDINTASQARTMNSIVETFMKTHYAVLMAEMSSDVHTVEISYGDDGEGCPTGTAADCFYKGYSAFVPFGYTTSDLKNYQSPRIYVHRDRDSLISYIVYPSRIDLGKKRAARIASLVGANGGMVSTPFGSEGSSHIYGTGGAWELNSSMVQELDMDEDSLIEHSLVVTSNEPITMSDMDSEKFLYRVPPDGDGKDFHNTMVTDLFMGGHGSQETTSWSDWAREYYSIFNVRKLTLNTNCNKGAVTNSSNASNGAGDTCPPNVADLYIGKPFVRSDGWGTAADHQKHDEAVDANTGAAWIYGNLAALNENFRLFREDDSSGIDRLSGYDVMEFARKNNEYVGTDTVNLSVFRAENKDNSARISMMDDFVQVKEDPDHVGEFLVGSSSKAGGLEGGFIYAGKDGDVNFLRLNSPDEIEDMSPELFRTYINRKGGVVYINGGSSETDKMETYINDMGGTLSAGKQGSWMLAIKDGNSSQVHLLKGSDFTSGAADDRIFSVGDTDESSLSNMIYADIDKTSLRGNLLQVYNPQRVSNEADMDAGQTRLGIDEPADLHGGALLATRYTDILGSTYMGNKSMQAAPSGESYDGLYSRGNWVLGVAGSAWVDDLLWARHAWFKDAGMQELHAGFSSYAEWKATPNNGWLNAYEDKVMIRNRLKGNNTPDYNSSDTMFYADSSRVKISDLEGAWAELTGGTARFGSEGNFIFAASSAADSSAINMVGSSFANIYTAQNNTDSFVNIQKGAMKFKGQPPAEGESYANAIEAKANEFSIQTQGAEGGSANVQFFANADEIRTRYVDFSVENDESAAVFKVMPNAENEAADDANVQVHGTLHVDGNQVVHVASNLENRADAESGDNAHAMLEVDPSYVQIWARTQNDDTSWGDYARHSSGEGNAGYYALLKVNPGDITGSSRTGADNNASVYVRRGAIELEESISNSGETGYAADEGFGYLKANRLVSNATLEGGGLATVPAPYTVEGQSTPGAAYDQYMVNPAYTSVMHDIKLTTRGGARLSDILPDYVLKGVYNLINNCSEGASVGDRCNITDMGTWAHSYIGVIPFASCPPGYVNMATIVPISFNMGQAGDIIKASSLGKQGLTGAEGRWVVNPWVRQQKILSKALDDDGIAYPALHEFSSWSFNAMTGDFIEDISQITANRIEGWYWGFNAVHETNNSDTDSDMKTNNAGTGDAGTNYVPWEYAEETSAGYRAVAEALYFQQNTWLKTSLDKRADNHGWNAYMGFLYDTTQWGSAYGLSAPVKSNFSEGGGNEGGNENLGGSYVWNFFPVPTNTLEGHATVYCYFDRSKFLNGGWAGLVDNIDQLNSHHGASATGASFRELYNKPDNAYTKRLNDPTLKYNDPW